MIIDPKYVFTREQLAMLERHLSEKIPSAGGALAIVLESIAYAVSVAQFKIEHAADLRVERSKAHRHFKALHATAAHLQTLLAKERPVLGTLSIDWSLFDQQLATVLASAARQRDSTVPPRSRDRSRDAWRDELIAAIHRVYPPGKATRHANRHFEQTVANVLQTLGHGVEDLHGAITRALRRFPEAPLRHQKGEIRRRR